MKKETALTLFNFAGITSGADNTGSIYKRVVEPIIDPKTNNIIGEKITLRMVKQSDAKDALGLKGKDNAETFNRVSQEAQVLAFRRLKAELNTMDENALSLKRFVAKRGKDGLLDMSMRIKEVPLRQGDHTLEEIAEVFEITVEEAARKMAKAGVRPKPSVNVASEVVPPKEISAGIEEAAREAEATEKAAAQAQANADAGEKAAKKKVS